MNERKSGAQMAEELTNFLNSALPDQEKEFVEALMREHRTLQADTFRLFYKSIEGWSQAWIHGRYDERNKDACKASFEIVSNFFNK